MKLKNKTAVITGGSGGIGITTAELFLQQGARVLIVDIDENALKEAAEKLNHESLSYFVADVSQAEQVQAYANYAKQTFGTIDIFFNNAGIEGLVKPIEQYPEDVFDKVLSINVKGVWLGLKYVLPLMNQGGSIINTSSVAGLSGTANVTAYVTSKHAVIGLTRSVALEATPRGIRVNSIHPSPVDNRMMRSLEAGFSPQDAKQAKEAFEQSIPLGRYATNEDIANGVLFLASDESRFMTGTKLVIDGGMTQN